MKKICLIISSIILFTVSNFDYIFAQDSYTEAVRKELLNNTLSLCPKDFQQYLSQKLNVVYEAMQFQLKSNTKLTPSGLQSIYVSLLKDIKTGRMNDYNTFRSFGVLADGISSIYPGFYCKHMNITPDILIYDGFQEVTDIYLKVSELQNKYKYPCENRNNKDSKIYNAEVGEIYNIVVNEIVDVWLSVWKQSGYDIKSAYPSGVKLRCNAREEQKAISSQDYDTPSTFTPSDKSLPNLDMSKPVHVDGYYRKDGTYVRPHTRSRPSK